MAFKIYFDKNGRHKPDPVTGHTGTPFRVVNELEGKLACKYQLDYLERWEEWFTKAPNNKHLAVTKDWFETFGILPRQKGFHGPHGNKYTCNEVFQDCRDKCKDYLKKSGRFSYLPTPCFGKVERAIAKGIELIAKRDRPYPETKDNLWKAQDMAQIRWILGQRPQDTFHNLFEIKDVENVIKDQYEDNDSKQ